MRKISKRSAVIAGISVVVIGGGAAAFAANGWTIGGSGTAEANAATITPLTATSSFDKTIFPGLQTTMLTKVTNSNEFPVKLVDNVVVSPNGVVVTPAGSDANTCKSGILSTPDVIKTDFPGTPTIAKQTTNQGVTSNVTIGSLPQSCAGKTITVSYTFSGVQQAS